MKNKVLLPNGLKDLERERMSEMGRPRTTDNKRRRPISISLPRDLIIEWDRSLSTSQSRSRHIERLLKRELRPLNETLDSAQVEYYCSSCDQSFLAMAIKTRARGVHYPIERPCRSCEAFATRHDFSKKGGV